MSSPSRPPRRILVVCTQRIGDVLLATPLAHSLKAAWPKASLDFLVLPGTEGVLAGNPDVDGVLVFPQRAGWREKLRQFARLWRRYDLALATVPTDRARLYARVAARHCLGLVTPEEHGWLKRRLLSATIDFDDRETHTVSMALRLAERLGIAPLAKVQPPRLDPDAAGALRRRLNLEPDSAYAVLHPSPKFRYKMWESERWVELAADLRRRGLRVLLTGSGDPVESAYVRDIADAVPEGAECLAGELSLAETAELLRSARVYVGPDTAVTHLAAAVGIPCIALFGPSNPIKWGPWPQDRQALGSPWPWRGGGRNGNVWLIQGEGDCVPCLLEGCDRHVESGSKCLQGITMDRVLPAIREALQSQDVS